MWVVEWIWSLQTWVRSSCICTTKCPLSCSRRMRSGCCFPGRPFPVMFGGAFSCRLFIKFSVEQKKIKLSSVTHVPSGLMGCATAALGWWVGGRRGNPNMLEFFCTMLYNCGDFINLPLYVEVKGWGSLCYLQTTCSITILDILILNWGSCKAPSAAFRLLGALLWLMGVPCSHARCFLLMCARGPTGLPMAQTCNIFKIVREVVLF